MKFYSTKILILIIICNLAALAGYYLLFRYIGTTTREASSLTNAVDVGQQKNSRFNSLRALVKDTEWKSQQLEAFLLPVDSEISFIEQIETLAKNSGLSEKTNNILNVSDCEACATKSFKMQLETVGSWNNTLYFLSQVENLPYNVRVEGFSLNRQAAVDKKTGPTWLAKFDINVTESVTENIQHE